MNPFPNQATQSFSPFSGMNHAEMSGRRPYLTEGNYVVRIEKVIFKATRGKGDALIAELEVVESDNPERKAGSPASWYQSFADKDIGFGSAKEFALAVLGYDPHGNKAAFANVDTEGPLAAAVSPANAFGGRLVRVSCFVIQTKKGTDFTKHQWKPYEGEQVGAPPSMQTIVSSGAAVAMVQAAGGRLAPPTPPAVAAPPPAAPKGQWNGTMFVIPGPNGTWIADPNGGR